MGWQRGTLAKGPSVVPQGGVGGGKCPRVPSFCDPVPLDRSTVVLGLFSAPLGGTGLPVGARVRHFFLLLGRVGFPSGLSPGKILSRMSKFWIKDRVLGCIQNDFFLSLSLLEA